MNAVEVTKLTKAFGARRALDGVSFELPAGAFLSIFGPNGAGKSTLLRVLATLARPTAGEAKVGGVDLLEEPEAARAQLGLISHSPMLYLDLTAQQNLELYAQMYGVEEPAARALELLDAVGLKHRRLDTVRTFSRGMTQRLAIARALIHDPQVVLLDEPYAGLDPRGIEIFDELIAAHREGRTFIMVSHDLTKGYEMCTHALVLARGRVVQFAPREQLDFPEFSQLYAQTVGLGVA